jgi:hypothetical protein
MLPTWGNYRPKPPAAPSNRCPSSQAVAKRNAHHPRWCIRGFTFAVLRCSRPDRFERRRRNATDAGAEPRRQGADPPTVLPVSGTVASWTAIFLLVYSNQNTVARHRRNGAALAFCALLPFAIALLVVATLRRQLIINGVVFVVFFVMLLIGANRKAFRRICLAPWRCFSSLQ